MTKVVCTIVLSLILLFAGKTAESAESSVASMYSDDVLLPLLERRKRVFEQNFNNIVVKLLLPQQAQKLKNVKFEFPLRDQTREPNAFYSGRNTAVFSIASMKFWEDILTAVAWLNLNGYSPDTVNDYMLMIRYGRFWNSVPSPVTALCVPSSDILNDKKLNELIDRAYNRTMTFIMLHELGHIYFGHPGYAHADFEQIRRNETEADDFALAAMARMGEVPDIVTYLTAMAMMARLPNEFGSNQEYLKYSSTLTHPTYPARLRAIADNLVKNAEAYASVQGDSALKFTLLGSMIGNLSRTLDDPRIQNVMATKAKMLTEDSLGPRRIGEVIPKSCDSSPVLSNMDFSGVYRGKWTYLSSAREFEVTLSLVRHDKAVSGLMAWGNVPGRIKGLITGDALHFRFEVAIENGSGVLTKTENGLLGTWGDKEKLA